MSESTIDVKTLTAAMRDLMNPAKAAQAAVSAREPGRPHARIACVSTNGAKFNAVVAASKEFPDFGRVKTLEDYQYPERAFPPEMDQFNGIPITELTVEAKSWLYKNTYQADLRKYVGEPFDITIRADMQDQVNKIRAERESKMLADLSALTAPEVGATQPEKPAKSK